MTDLVQVQVQVLDHVLPSSSASSRLSFSLSSSPSSSLSFSSSSSTNSS